MKNGMSAGRVRGQAVAAAGLISLGALCVGISSAAAADLGGNCCADLEERIAELESTAARKGNRKVSLTISGYIAQELTWWDDGVESNAYLHGFGPTQATHVKVGGQAQFAPGWKAGYLLRLQNLDDNPFGGLDQNNDNASNGLNLQMSFWYIDNDKLGRVSVGKMAHAGKSAAMFTDLSGTQVIDNYTFLAGFPGFFVRGSGLRWGQLSYCYSQNLPLGGDCNGVVVNGVRYDTPTIAGFTFSASWGEDDFWEVAGRYAGTFGDFKVALGTAFSNFTDENTTGAAVLVGKDSEFFQAGGYIEHQPSGLFVHAAYGHEDNNNAALVAGGTAPDSHHWYVKGGIRQKWTSLGATIVYGDYAEYIDQMAPQVIALGATSSKLQRYGGGIAQEFDAAAMTLYLKYQRYDGEVSAGAAAPSLESLDLVSVGAVINF